MEKPAGPCRTAAANGSMRREPLCGTLVTWLQAGAPIDSGDPPTVETWNSFRHRSCWKGPGPTAVDGAGEVQPTAASATSPTGLVPDSNNDNSAPVTAGGPGDCGHPRRGLCDGPLRAPYRGKPAIVLPAGLKLHAAREPPANYIDELVAPNFERCASCPAPSVQRCCFLLRRVEFDISGQLPTAARVPAFLADRDPRQAGELIDRLLAARSSRKFGP